MANIGATTAFYKVETSLSRANTEVSKSMERLATGKANANAGDRSSYVAMADTFRLDYVGTKAGIKGASVVMGYLETGMRVLDSASALLARLQELAILGGNDTNSIADHEAINLEAEAIADEFNRLMSSATYKGKDIFVDTAGSEYVSMGGRDAQMTFGIGKIDYSAVYGDARTVQTGTGIPNAGELFNLTKLPSDAVLGPVLAETLTLTAGKTYEITTLPADATEAAVMKAAIVAGSDLSDVSQAIVGSTFTVNEGANINITTGNYGTLKDGSSYEVIAKTAGANSLADIDKIDAQSGSFAATVGGTVEDDLAVGDSFTLDGGSDVTGLSTAYTLKKTSTAARFREIDASVVTRNIEVVQGKINGARVQAGSQYAALESAVQYTTDLTAQYELGYNTVNDVNFSMETAHLAKNQILQQAATAMLAQANEGQQGLLQLIQR